MSCFFGSLSIVWIYGITFFASRSRFAAVIAALLLATHPIFVQNALYAEVYGPQTCFVLLSLLLWLIDRPVPAAFSFAMSVLITPSSLLALPLLVILRPQRRALVTLGAISAAVLSFFVLPRYADYLFGDRGLLRAAEGRLGPGLRLLKEGHEVFLGFFLFLPLLLMGLRELIRQRRLWALGAGLLLLWLGGYMLGERFMDVPVQLPFYAMLCCVVGLGCLPWLNEIRMRNHGRGRFWILPILAAVLIVAMKLTEERLPRGAGVYGSVRGGLVLAVAAVALLASAGSLLLRAGRFSRIVPLVLALLLPLGVNGLRAFSWAEAAGERALGYRDLVLKMSRTAGPDFLAVGGWGEGILLEHYLYRRSYTGRWINTQWLDGKWGESWEMRSRKKLEEAVAARREIWLLGPDPARLSGLQAAGYVFQPFGSIVRARAGP